ncbi:MAG: gliding motility-associated C-terminal domain-containing protein [Bacteroidetes bacterium]|nr:gliding motility-associated C-terminal domain-containing protein [Bacteroidota bacterium]
MSFKKSMLISFLIILIYRMDAQIVITSSDMPNVKDTVRLSVKQTLPVFNQNLTGANYTWDYSFLIPDSQRVEKFLSPFTTGYPFAGALSTYALTNYNPDALPFALLGRAPTNALNFYKKQSTQLAITVQGVTTGGNALPILQNPADIVYRFPLQYGNKDSSNSGYANTLPGFGYFSKKQKRVNTVDGWGMLTTPYGTFNTLRVKSIFTVTDSIYLDTLGFGFNIPMPTVYEFKWLAQGRKLPVLEIDATAAFTGSAITVTDVLFQDSLWGDLNIRLDPSATCPAAKEGALQSYVKGGRYPLKYSWSNGQTTSGINKLVAGTYDVIVTERYGKTATASASVEMKVEDASCLNIPNGFTPDGDGVNDYWNIRTLDQFKNCKVEIFNQWGSLIFTSTGYTTPWDGKYNNQAVEAGTYYYVIDLSNGYDKYNGAVTIIK